MADYRCRFSGGFSLDGFLVSHNSSKCMSNFIALTHRSPEPVKPVEPVFFFWQITGEPVILNLGVNKNATKGFKIGQFWLNFL